MLSSLRLHLESHSFFIMDEGPIVNGIGVSIRNRSLLRGSEAAFPALSHSESAREGSGRVHIDGSSQKV